MNKRPALKPIALLVVSAAAAFCAIAAPASAQSSSTTKKVEKLEPPTPGQAKTDGIVVPMLVGLLVAGAALTANLIPSKRGHQD